MEAKTGAICLAAWSRGSDPYRCPPLSIQVCKTCPATLMITAARAASVFQSDGRALRCDCCRVLTGDTCVPFLVTPYLYGERHGRL